MARRKYSAKKRNKIEPSALTMTFVMPTVGAGRQVHHIDLSQCASLLNRRFYRQGINWAVASIKAVTTTQQIGAQISVGMLPNSWIMSNSWEKGMRAWQRMNKEALMETDSVRPKFLDFKIYANRDHHLAGYAANLLPISSATSTLPVQVATAGEWEPSKFVVPNSANPGFSTEREIIAVGANYQGNGASGFNSVSLIEGYAASRGLPNVLDPNTPDDAADVDGAQPANYLQELFNEGTNQDEQILEDMISENNIAPYPFENDGVNTDTMYPGGANQLSTLELHDFEVVTASTVGGTTRLKGGNFPCGLMEIQTFGYVEGSSITLQVNLVPGNHRGYLCEPMTEM
jgi:hypothetical protein